MESKPVVIAISAVAGGGKTTFVTEAAKALDAAVLMFDDYTTGDTYPPDFERWLLEGADLNEWKSPQFAPDLKQLIEGQSVESRRDGSTIKPKPITILVEPTGRQRSTMAELIDFVVFIDTPLEISLARLLNKWRENMQHQPNQFMLTASSYLQSYLAGTSKVYIEIQKQVMDNCDLVLDWQLPIKEQIRIMSEEFGLGSLKEETADLGIGSPTSIEQITAEWFSATFQEQGYIKKGRVTDIVKKKSIRTDGGNLEFLELKLTDDAETEGISSDCILKMYKTAGVQELLGRHEGKLYETIGEQLKELPIPECYYSGAFNNTNRPFLILDDISGTHTDLKASPPFPPAKHYCEEAVECLAEIQAFWWDHEDLKGIADTAFSFYACEENYFDEDGMGSWFSNQEQILNRMLQASGDNISNRAKEMYEKALSLIPQISIARAKTGNVTLIHGDAHFHNFMYPKDPGNETVRTVLIDWSLWGLGIGAQDLAYMISLFWDPDTRYIRERDLVKRYHDALLRFGVENYSWDDCWYDYRLNTFVNLYRILWWYDGLGPFELWWRTLHNTTQAIDDLNCVELLEG